jgi:4-alpha-glucanotransferase
MGMRLPALDRRRAGVLLHLSSLDAPLGRGGRAFINWIARAGFTVWQFLPVGPPGDDGSPYWVRSDSAGNVNFIDPDELPRLDGSEYEMFVRSSHDWLDDYACFEVLRAKHGNVPWWMWPTDYRDRTPGTIERVRRDFAAELREVQTKQFIFAVQWRKLREYAHSQGVRLFGDVPFYVAPDSAETWAHRQQFQLDATGQAISVAGVPPDYFSETGQFWGNPLYNWDAMQKDGFLFWRARVRRQLDRLDLLRIDHFRALAAHWAIPADAPDARSGVWKTTPGHALFQILRDELNDLPIVAEDLGVITPDVDALRKDFKLPGMRVIQFGFDGTGDNPHLPHMHERDSVVYTGTHDNDTAMGWYTSLPQESQRFVDYFMRLTPGAMPEALIRAALGSVGGLAIIPAQDLLALGSEARLNTPGTAAGNWSWRLPHGALNDDLAHRFAELNRIYGRI